MTMVDPPTFATLLNSFCLTFNFVEEPQNCLRPCLFGTEYSVFTINNTAVSVVNRDVLSVTLLRMLRDA